MIIVSQFTKTGKAKIKLSQVTKTGKHMIIQSQFNKTLFFKNKHGYTQENSQSLNSFAKFYEITAQTALRRSQTEQTKRKCNRNNHSTVKLGEALLLSNHNTAFDLITAPCA